MPRPTPDSLTRRERAIMDILHRRGRATAAEVRADLADAPTYSTVRALLRLLEAKGHVVHAQDGPRYVFSPTVRPEEAKRSALTHLVRTFFEGSVESAVAALVQTSRPKLTDAELERIARRIRDAKKEGR